MGRDYDRKDLFQRAEQARKKGRRRAAIARYRELLAVDRDAPEVHARLAPLLARTGQEYDAWLSYQAAAEGFMRAQESDRALALYYEAAHHLPRRTDIWQMLARLQCARGKTDEALRVLRDGRNRLRRGRDRARAIHLLRVAHEIEPWNPDTVLDLARLLWRTRQRGEALLLLEALSQRVVGAQLRRARGLQFRISLHPAHAWRWMRCWGKGAARPRKTRSLQRAAAS